MIIKNSNLRRNLMGNRYKILAVIVAIILIPYFIQVLNEMTKQKNISNNTLVTESVYKPEETVISGDEVEPEIQENNEKIIEQFIQYCNAKEIEKAYNLLTDECKEVVFNSSIEKFKTNYVEKLFRTYKIYNMQSWINRAYTTYKVRILEDILSTGTTGKEIEDYYTVVQQNGQTKLNIYSYIGREIINTKQTDQDITIQVINKDVFMEHELYNIKVKNNTNNTIMLDTQKYSKSTYLTARNNVTYRAFTNDLFDMDLKVSPKTISKISMKFNKKYSSNTSIEKMTFTDIIINLEEYEKLEDKQNYEKTKI